LGSHSGLRKEQMRSVLLILCLSGVSIFALSAPRHHPETISGRVVAYSSFPACLNGNAYWSMVIRVQRPKDTRSQFIRVDFSLPCNQSPVWVSTKPPIQKFRLFRQRDRDDVLTGSMVEESKQDLALPIWNHPPGTEHDELPFGRVLPSYLSADLPLLPVV
jgi:hypothetical protein